MSDLDNPRYENMDNEDDNHDFIICSCKDIQHGDTSDNEASDTASQESSFHNVTWYFFYVVFMRLLLMCMSVSST